MLRRLAAGMALAVTLSIGLLVAAATATPATVLAASSCTGWVSESIPPTSIRVYRTLGPDAGQVQEVPFRRYVEVVMAAEFGPGSPAEALRAGAIAVKQYGWYYAMHWRGGHSGTGECYDVVDNGRDQYYLPLSKQPAQSHLDAVASTWLMSLRKGSRFFATGYWAGPDVPCGQVTTGWRLLQRSAYRCAKDGMLAEEILRVFYGPDLSVVVPGANDMTGDGLGDIAVLVPGARSVDPTQSPSPPIVLTAVAVREYSHGVVQTSMVPGVPTTQLTADASIGDSIPSERAIADVDGDGRADLVFLRRDATGQPEVAVARAVPAAVAGLPDPTVPVPGGPTDPGTVATAFAPPETWWSAAQSGPRIAPGATVRLLAADFTGDGRVDIALLTDGALAPDSGGSGTGVGTGPGTGMVTAWVLPGTGTGFGPGIRWWGPAQIDLGAAVVRAGDVDGDGRSEIILGVPASSVPVVVPTPAPNGSIQPPIMTTSGTTFLVLGNDHGTAFRDPEPFANLPDFELGMGPVLVGDWNRDGREDLMVIRSGVPGGMLATGLISTGTSFDPQVFRSTTSGFRVSAAKWAVADVNGDGRSDVIALYDAGVAGTRLIPFISSGKRLSTVTSTTDPTLVWATAEPF